MDLPSDVAMASPEHFDVLYEINPHMEGNVGNVDLERARQQWSELQAVYTALDISVHTVAGKPGLPDMVFCANQTLPFPALNGTGKGGFS